MLCGAEYIVGHIVTTLSTFVISGIITYSVNKGIHVNRYIVYIHIHVNG